MRREKLVINMNTNQKVLWVWYGRNLALLLLINMNTNMRIKSIYFGMGLASAAFLNRE
jgi:hypothetical protein